jgi:hypothetical protein
MIKMIFASTCNYIKQNQYIKSIVVGVQNLEIIHNCRFYSKGCIVLLIVLYLLPQAERTSEREKTPENYPLYIKLVIMFSVDQTFLIKIVPRMSNLCISRNHKRYKMGIQFTKWLLNHVYFRFV